MGGESFVLAPKWGLGYTPRADLSQGIHCDVPRHGTCPAGRQADSQALAPDPVLVRRCPPKAKDDNQPSKRSTWALRFSPERHQWQKCSQLLVVRR